MLCLCHPACRGGATGHIAGAGLGCIVYLFQMQLLCLAAGHCSHPDLDELPSCEATEGTPNATPSYLQAVRTPLSQAAAASDTQRRRPGASDVGPGGEQQMDAS